ncbi:MAG: glycosyl hydrolase [Bacteroidota bacterium]
MIKSVLGVLVFVGLLSTNTSGQQVPPSTTSQIEASIQQRAKLRNTSVFKTYPIRNVGPVIMSGRVTDIAVHPEKARVFYVGYASGGLFKTTNSGATMEPIFDHQDVLGIGDIALSRANPDVIWVGTGENNSSRSSYAGAGVFKSTDAGETWEYAGLRNTQHIGRIVTHPTDVNTAWVGSMGALYSNNEERGMYKTTDGGKTWNKTLFVNDSTGVIDLVIHPENPEVLWVSTWERDRKAWNFKEGGNGSSIYKSTDGGETWTKSVQGFPQGDYVGRIGLDISHSNPNVLYAVVDNQFETKEERDISDERLTAGSFVKMKKNDFLKLDNKALNRYLRSNQFPKEYTAKSVKMDVQNGAYEPKALSDYLGDANAALFNTNITGLEMYRSDNGGNSWTKVNSYDLPRVFNTYGYYFGEVRVDPNDEETIYTFGVPFLKSTDGGKTWEPKAENQPVHVDHHALWINPDDSEHILLGNDGGLYESHDGGENFIHHNVVPVGQFYTVAVDMEEPYNIYGGLQDNGTFFGPSNRPSTRYNPWERLFGGDGMHVAPSPDNVNTVYVGFQYGNYFRLDRDKGNSARITPKHKVGEPRYRYNWNTPINLSHHNPGIVYFGSQRLNRSFDKGNTWTPISPDLTHDLPNGDVPYSTITTIAESPLNFQTIWVGTDDGKVQLTTDGGANWVDVSKGLPEYRWVSEIHASAYDEQTAFVSLNGYRFDEFTTYLFKTTNGGKSWTSIKGNLPDEVTNVIYQDPVLPEVLYAGLDHGTYISMNGGKEWEYLNVLPNVASYDMLVHPRDMELVIGTHGRSIWVMDVKPIHQVAKRAKEDITAIKPDEIRYSNRWGNKFSEYRDRFMPSVPLMYYLGSERATQNVTLDVMDSDGETVTSVELEGTHGFNKHEWDLVIGGTEEKPEFLGKGTYTLKFTRGKSFHEVEFVIK